MRISTRRFVLQDARLHRSADLAIGTLGFLKWSEIPQRTGEGGATGDGVRIKAVTFKTKCLHSTSRRTVGRPSGNEMPLEPVGSRRQSSGSFGGDFLNKGLGGLHTVSSLRLEISAGCDSGKLSIKSKIDRRRKRRVPLIAPGSRMERVWM